jgi:integrase
MAHRRRLARNRDLMGIQNLFRNKAGYFTYRHPQTGKTFGLGRDKEIAVAEAVQANLRFQRQAITLLDRIDGRDKRTVSDWCDEYGHHPRMKYLREGLGHYILENLTPLQINDWLDAKWKDKKRMRQAMLGTAKVVLGAAIGKGWIKFNPASDLTTETPVTIRERLSFDEFLKIYEKAELPLKRAMELALMTGARRENVIRLKKADVHDGFLHIEHNKSKENEEPMKVRYPLSMYLPCLQLTLGDVIGRCKDNIISKYLIHHKANVGKAKPGMKFRDKTIEQQFRDAREAAGIVAKAGKTLPTFHEIRSLAKMLWDEQGIDTKLLLGHKTEKMSALYGNRRGKDWLTVSAKS